MLFPFLFFSFGSASIPWPFTSSPSRTIHIHSRDSLARPPVCLVTNPNIFNKRQDACALAGIGEVLSSRYIGLRNHFRQRENWKGTTMYTALIIKKNTYEKLYLRICQNQNNLGYRNRALRDVKVNVLTC